MAKPGVAIPMTGMTSARRPSPFWMTWTSISTSTSSGLAAPAAEEVDEVVAREQDRARLRAGELGDEVAARRQLAERADRVRLEDRGVAGRERRADEAAEEVGLAAGVDDDHGELACVRQRRVQPQAHVAVDELDVEDRLVDRAAGPGSGTSGCAPSLATCWRRSISGRAPPGPVGRGAVVVRRRPPAERLGRTPPAAGAAAWPHADDRAAAGAAATGVRPAGRGRRVRAP